MKLSLYFTFIVILIISCGDDEINPGTSEPGLFPTVIVGNFACSEGSLPLIIDSNIMNVNLPDSACDTITVDEVNVIDEESYSWLPNLCNEVGTQSIFKSTAAETTLTLVDRRHYVVEEAVLATCNEGVFNTLGFIKQRNEVVELSYMNEFFGFDLDTIKIELRSIINSYDGLLPNSKQDRLGIKKRTGIRTGTDLTAEHHIGETDFLSEEKIFHHNINLNGEDYTSVVEFKFMTDFNSPFSTDNVSTMYANDELGFFGFVSDGILYIKSE
ncbi:hypothetical protein N9L92_02750 [Saprospiraceae bacterium]|nr:hypothetical protein [Saprospiraceae bacterium]